MGNNYNTREQLKEWFLYVVECADGSLYTGITTDISRRIYEHNNTKKGAKYTRSRRPVRLVHNTKFCDRSQAAKAEAVFKKLSRKEKLNHVKGQTCK